MFNLENHKIWDDAYCCFNERYKYYALYAWGLPMVIVAVTVLMQFLPDSVTSGSILPYIGKQSCFFKGDLSTLVYLHIIAGLKVRLHRFILDLTTWLSWPVAQLKTSCYIDNPCPIIQRLLLIQACQDVNRKLVVTPESKSGIPLP